MLTRSDRHEGNVCWLMDMIIKMDLGTNLSRLILDTYRYEIGYVYELHPSNPLRRKWYAMYVQRARSLVRLQAFMFKAGYDGQNVGMRPCIFCLCTCRIGLGEARGCDDHSITTSRTY